MKTKVVRIGNSRGVRIPKPFIEEARLSEEVQLRIVASGVLIERTAPPRAGWAKAAAQLRDRGDDRLLDEPLPTDFDQVELRRE